MTCSNCGEEIVGEVYANCLHYECMMRGIIGSLAHLKKTCSCYIAGSTEGDPTDVSARDAARLAVIEFERQEREQRWTSARSN